MSASPTKIYGLEPVTATDKRQVTIVKTQGSVMIPAKREEYLKNLEYLETQIGRLAKMARDMRAEFLQLTIQ